MLESWCCGFLSPPECQNDGAILQTKRREKRRGRKGESERQAKLTRLPCQAVSVSALQHSVVCVSKDYT